MVEPVSTSLAVCGLIASLPPAFQALKVLHQDLLQKQGKRKQRKQAKERQLGDTLKESSQIVQCEYQVGRRRFGDCFVRGDEASQSAAHRICMHMQTHLIEVLKSAIKGTSDPILDCASLYHNVLSARQDTSNTFRELSQRLLASAPISRPRHACHSQPLVLVLPPSDRDYRDPSEILPVNTYAPEPNEQCCPCTPSRRDSHRTIKTVQSTRDNLDLDQDLLPNFDTTPSLKGEPRKTHYLPPSVVSFSPPTEYSAAIEDLQRRLAILSTNQNNEFAVAPIALKTGSAALLARQLKHSVLYAKTKPSMPTCPSPQRCSSHPRDFAFKSSKPSYLSVPSGSSRDEHNSYHKPHQSGDLPEASAIYCGSELPEHELQAEYPIAPKSSLDAELTSSATIADPREVAFDFRTNVKDIPAPPTRAGSAQIWDRDRTTGPPGTISPPVDQQGSNYFESKRWRSLHDTPSCNTSHKPMNMDTRTWSAPPAANLAYQHTFTGTCSAPPLPTPSPKRTTNISQPPAFCNTAQLLQSSPLDATWQTYFTFMQNSSAMVCSTCNSSIPTQPFNVRCNSSVWRVSMRFMARSHKPQAQFGCVFCPAVWLNFRSRNELWAHLETHSSVAFEGDVDFVELQGK